MLTHGALHRLAIDRPPVSRALEFRSLTRAIIPTNRHIADKEGAGSKTVLITQSIVKSLGHMWNFSGSQQNYLAKITKQVMMSIAERQLCVAYSAQKNQPNQ